MHFAVLSRTIWPMHEDIALVRAYRKGDHSAFEELYNRHVRGLYDFVYYRTHHRQTAEDIVSQTFLQALEHIGSYREKRGNFGAWIFGIARNLIVDHYRSLRPTVSAEDAWDLPAESDVERDAHVAVEAARVSSLLRDLKPRQRDVLLLRIWQGKPFAEIAEILGTTEAACKMTYKRTLETMRNALLILFFFFFSITLS